MTTPQRKREKKVKAWAVLDKNDRNIWAAFTEKENARAEKKEWPSFHRNDVIVPCFISFPTTTKSRNKRI